MSLSVKVIKYLTEEGHDFISLCHRDVLSQETNDSSGDFPSLEGDHASALYCALNYSSTNDAKEYCTSSEKELEMLEYAKNHRKAYMLSGEQHLFMGFAWIIQAKWRRLELCPKSYILMGL